MGPDLTNEKLVEKIQVDRKLVVSYQFWSKFFFNLLFVLCFVGVWLPVWIAWMLGVGQWYSGKWADLFDAELTTKRVKITCGVFKRQIKSIPLDRITDIIQSQGIIERRLGIWSLHIQTAGAGQTVAEGIIYAPVNPEQIRELIFSARNNYIEGSKNKSIES